MRTCSSCGRESPDEFAFCPGCGAALAPAPVAREVRKTVTVVFCDVTGSTALGERLDPESLRDVQTRYFEAMRAAIERHGGTVEKYIGDAVMAVFGIPQLHEDDALRAARAAHDMREALATLNEELERDRAVTLRVRIGVNTGEVVAGDPGAAQALVTGDAVNVAARLEQHAAPGEVLLGEATHRLVRELVETEPVEPFEVKGKGEPVTAWRLLGVADATTPVPRRLDSPMVGRERQLAQLQQAFRAAVDDAACQLFTVLGSAGVGKSRLVREFLDGLDEDVIVLQGRCLPYGEGITYYPVLEAVKQAAGLADFDLPDVVRSKVCSVLEGDEHQDLVCRHLSQLMGIAEAAAGDETFWAIRRFFEATARDRPLVLVFDDIHWGEPTFLDLVEHVADWSRGAPILLLCMARPDLLDARPTWGGGKLNATTVTLEPLSGEQAEALVANLLGPGELPGDVAERITTTAEGNPLFVEETLEMLIDDGVLVREGGRWIVSGDVAAVTVPPSIQALLASRLDRLGPGERSVLEAAAVAGKWFHLGAVRDLVDEDLRADVRQDLMSLVRKELVRPDRSTMPGQDAFRFRHLVIRDAAYDAIPKARRAELHERFADWLERVGGESVVEQEEILAYHLESAHAYRSELGPPDERTRALGERAAARLASAGRRASARGDAVAAANLLRRALALEPGGDRRARVLFDLGDALADVGDLRVALPVLDEAVEAASAGGDRSLEWIARVRRAGVRSLAEPFAMPSAAHAAELEEAISVFEAIGDEAGLATARIELAMRELLPMRLDRLGTAARDALVHARRAGDDRLISASIDAILISKYFGPSGPQEILRTLDELHEDIARSRQLEAWDRILRSMCHGLGGDLEGARRLSFAAREIASALGFPLFMEMQVSGDVELWFGNPSLAVAMFRRKYEALRALGNEGYNSSTAADLARALFAARDHDEAERFAAIARATAPDDDLSAQAAGRSAQALVLSARGEHAPAEALAREAVDMIRDADSPNPQGDAWMDLAQVLRAAGELADAAAAAREALAHYERKGNRPSSASTRAFLDELGADAG